MRYRVTFEYENDTARWSARAESGDGEVVKVYSGPGGKFDDAVSAIQSTLDRLMRERGEE